jgi:hypothetical protein
MDADFDIALTVPKGISMLERLLPEFPIALAIGKHDQSDEMVLKQCAVSTIAGFYFKEKKGDVQFYGVTVASNHPGAPEEVLLSISQVLQRANLSHRIVRIIHELNTDEEVISFKARA